MSLKKDMADEAMPYERLKKLGASALSDAELIAIIVRTGVADYNPVDIGQRLILEMGERGLAELGRMSIKRLKEIPGIGEIKAIQLLAVAEMAKRISKQQAYLKLSFKNPDTIADYFMDQLSGKSEEEVWCVLLDTKCQRISEKMLSKGTANASFITPREVFRYALEEGAVSIILIHNHPSGDPTPSKDDEDFTLQLHEAGKTMGISLLDHIIIGDKKYFSLHEAGLLDY